MLYELLKGRFINKKNIQIINKAVSDSNGNGLFYEFSDGNAYNTLSKKWVSVLTDTEKFRDNIPTENIPDEVSVETVTIDSAVKLFGKPDFIKIDVEGYEKNVIQGMSFSPSLISIECNLPVFTNESIFCVDKLASLSDKYRFNFSISEPPEVLVLDKWCDKDAMIDILKSEKYKFMELFAKLF